MAGKGLVIFEQARQSLTALMVFRSFPSFFRKDTCQDARKREQ
jgi:hypothetical protein